MTTTVCYKHTRGQDYLCVFCYWDLAGTPQEQEMDDYKPLSDRPDVLIRCASCGRVLSTAAQPSKRDMMMDSDEAIMRALEWRMREQEEREVGGEHRHRGKPRTVFERGCHLQVLRRVIAPEDREAAEEWAYATAAEQGLEPDRRVIRHLMRNSPYAFWAWRTYKDGDGRAWRHVPFSEAEQKAEELRARGRAAQIVPAGVPVVADPENPFRETENIHVMVPARVWRVWQYLLSTRVRSRDGEEVETSTPNYVRLQRTIRRIHRRRAISAVEWQDLCHSVIMLMITHQSVDLERVGYRTYAWLVSKILTRMIEHQGDIQVVSLDDLLATDPDDETDEARMENLALIYEEDWGAILDRLSAQELMGEWRPRSNGTWECLRPGRLMLSERELRALSFAIDVADRRRTYAQAERFWGITHGGIPYILQKIRERLAREEGLLAEAPRVVMRRAN